MQDFIIALNVGTSTNSKNKDINTNNNNKENRKNYKLTTLLKHKINLPIVTKSFKILASCNCCW